MFGPQNHDFYCANYNATTEKHGNDNVKAGDLKLEMNFPNTVLDEFDKDLRQFLYSKENLRPGDAPEQGSLLPSDGLVHLKHPKLAPLHLEEKFTGYSMVLESELGFAEPQVFKDVTLSGFQFHAMDGGTVKIVFTARCKPSPEQSGHLHYLVKEEGRITLTPPAAGPRQADIDDEYDNDDDSDDESDDELEEETEA